jgi:hypothetical protein
MQECNGKSFSVMSFVSLETEPPETSPLFFDTVHMFLYLVITVNCASNCGNNDN